MSRLAPTLLAVLCWFGTAGSARAENDTLNPRTIALGESLRAAATGALAISLNPAGLALSRTYVLEGSYGYRPEDHAHIQAVSICDSVTARVGACLYYDHLSADPSEPGDRWLHEVGLTMAVPLGESLTFGVTNKYVSYHETFMEETPVDNSRKGLAFDAGLTYRVMPLLSLAFVGYNLFGGDQSQYTRALGFGAVVSFTPKLRLAADGKYDLERSSGRYGGGLEYLFSGADGQQGVPLRAGYVYDAATHASYITGGLGVLTPRVGLDLGARKQVSDGKELMVQLSLRLFFPN